MAPREKIDRTTASWSTHDKACSHCRERKIRCGRERPQCTNCKRDGVECGYFTPGKRVNHIKLLCNNFDGLEDRLSNIETELSFMNALLRTDHNRRLSIDKATADECSAACSVYDPLNEDNTSLPPIDRHVVCRSSRLTDRYHGTCALASLCHELCDTLLSSQHVPARDRFQKSQKPAVNDAAKNLLGKICLEAGVEEFAHLQVNQIPIQLPPKQLLLMAESKFFHQIDCATDLFDQSIFRSNVQRVYSRPFTSEDEAWAICFNTIILLALDSGGTEGSHHSQTDASFVQPFISTVCSALSNPRILLTAKMINIQALALLSIAAQMYYPLGSAESIFAQACVLARMMGLHQARSASENVSPEEAQERFKVFNSLYLRDKSSLILRGSICWLPSTECGFPLNVDENRPVEHKSVARTQLSKLEYESYQLLHSTDLTERSSARYQSALLRIEQRLEHWANVNEISSPSYGDTGDVGLKLEFLATRIYLLRKSPEPNHICKALNDSRTSCLLVVISFGKHEQAMAEQLDLLLHSEGPSILLGRQQSGRSSKEGRVSLTESARFSRSSCSLSQSQRLLDTFSVPAFFLLATNVIWPSSAYDESRAEQDLDLLRRTCACFTELRERIEINNHIRKLGQVFDSLLYVVDFIKRSQPNQLLHRGRQHSTSAQDTASTEKYFGVQHQISEFYSLPSPSASSRPPSCLETSSTYNVPAITPDSSSAGISEWLTPLDSYYQSYDPLRQGLVFPYMQEQITQTQSSDGQFTSESDLVMNDYADISLFPEFRERNQATSSEFMP